MAADAGGVEPGAVFPFFLATAVPAAGGVATPAIPSASFGGGASGVRLNTICKLSCAISQPAPPFRFASPMRARSVPLPVPVRTPPPGLARNIIQLPAENLSPRSTSPWSPRLIRERISMRIEGQNHVFSPQTSGLVSALNSATFARGAEFFRTSPFPSSRRRRSSSPVASTGFGLLPAASQAAVNSTPRTRRASSLSCKVAFCPSTNSAAAVISGLGKRSTGSGSAILRSHGFSAVFPRNAARP